MWRETRWSRDPQGPIAYGRVIDGQSGCDARLSLPGYGVPRSGDCRRALSLLSASLSTWFCVAIPVVAVVVVVVPVSKSRKSFQTCP